MKKAGIAIDSWKLPIFERHLKQGGYTYQEGAGLTDDTRMLYVSTENLEALSVVVGAANIEAAKTGDRT